MKRLTVYLKYVKPENGKIKNTLSYKVRDERHTMECLSLNEGNVKKYTLSNLK